MQSSKKVILAVQNNPKMDRELGEKITGVEVKKNRAERRQEKRRKNRK